MFIRKKYNFNGLLEGLNLDELVTEFELLTIGLLKVIAG